MDALISRNEAVDAVNEYFSRINKLKRRGLNKGEKAISLDVIGAIKSLPSADIEDIIVSHEEIGYERGLRDGYAQAVTESDAESKWIPCSEVTGEGYPKENGFYYVTERNYGFYLDADTKQNVAHTSRFFNGDFTDRVYDENHSNIVAWLSLDWMSLPDPYKAEMEKETCNNTEENLQ